MRSFLLLLGMALLAAHALAQDMTVYDGARENGWKNYGWGTINYANTSPVHTGTASISFTDPAGKYQAVYLGHAAFNTAPYQSITFYIYPTVAGSNEVHVRATLSGSAQSESVPLSFTAGQVGQWQEETIPLASLGAGNVRNFTGFWIQNNTGGPLTFYLDAITLTAPPPPSVTPVTVNARRAVRTISGGMYGVNLAMWDAQLSGTSTGGILSAMGTGAVRFPGGSGSDDYDWHTDRQVSKPTFRWPGNAATFARVAEAQGAQAFVTVNYGSGTPEEAAAWVAYYNGNPTSDARLGMDSRGRAWGTAGYWAALRAEAPQAVDDGFNFLRVSHAAPYGFKYWEVGNECYGNWEDDRHGAPGSGLGGKPHDPVTYAKAFGNFYNAMLAVDPAIHIGAVSTPGEDSYNTNTGNHAVKNPAEGNSLHKGWTPVMLVTLRALGITPAFLIDHDYPENPGGENDAGLLQAGGTLVSDAASLRQIITDYLGAATGIELNVTELNSVSSNPGKQSTSLVNGLFMADALGNLANTEFNACTWWALRNGTNTSGNNSAALYGWREYGDYGVVSVGGGGPAANTPYPAFYTQKLLTHWGRAGDTVVSATSGYALLSVYAAHLAGGNLALLVINKHPTADLPTQISLSGFAPASGTAATYTYGKANDLASGDITTGAAAVSGTFNYTFPSYSETVLVLSGT
jgi:hypothetical protein